ncbi:hypothetical protein Tco_1063721 [Tanacetum coccineum]
MYSFVTNNFTTPNPYSAATQFRGVTHTDTLVGANLRTVTTPQRSSAPAMTTATTVTVTAGAATVVKETVVKPSLFATGSSSVGGTESIPVGFFDLTGNDFLVGDFRTIIDPDSDLQKHDQLFAEFNVGAARQMTLSVEVRMCVEYNIKEKRRLKSIVDDQAEVLKVKGRRVKRLKASDLMFKRIGAAEPFASVPSFPNFETAEKSLKVHEARDILCWASAKVAVYENSK